MGTPKFTVNTITPGLAGALVVFVQLIRTLPPPGMSAIPLLPDAPTSVSPASEALVVTPGNAGTPPIAAPVDEIAHVTPCAFAGFTSVNKRPRNIIGTNNRFITRILHRFPNLLNCPASLMVVYLPQNSIASKGRSRLKPASSERHSSCRQRTDCSLANQAR